jgi:fluoride exporter
VAVIWVAVALAGGAGAASRYAVDWLVTSRGPGGYPWGTLIVNVSGSLLIGLVAGAVAHHGAPGAFGTVAAAGFCGAYTTFSTLVYEAWRLAEARAYLQAAAHLASLLVGWLAAGVGWMATAL